MDVLFVKIVMYSKKARIVQSHIQKFAILLHFIAVLSDKLVYEDVVKRIVDLAWK